MSTLTFNLKMFDPKKKLVVVCSEGYESIIHHNWSKAASSYRN